MWCPIKKTASATTFGCSILGLLLGKNYFSGDGSQNTFAQQPTFNMLDSKEYNSTFCIAPSKFVSNLKGLLKTRLRLLPNTLTPNAKCFGYKARKQF